jgi:hypothetical protein
VCVLTDGVGTVPTDENSPVRKCEVESSAT